MALKKFFKKKNADAQVAEDAVDVDADTFDATAADDAAAGDSTPKKGKEKRGKRAKPRRKDETLASVLTESEPGAAVDVMRQVENFVLPAEVAPNGGYVVMVLPTADPSFGGLSRKQNKHKDKGLIINLMQAGDIEIVITPALLDDDALGIIPEHGTLERMDEFTILRDARFMWGIAVPNQEDGSLTVFTVPGQREEDADGKLYETAVKITRGDLDITEVINMQLVRSMIAIFDHDAEGYGEDGVVEAIDLVMEAYGIRRGKGSMPTTDDYMMVLYNSFPQIDPDYDPEAEVEPASEEDNDEQVEDQTEHVAEVAPVAAVLADDTDFSDDDVTPDGVSRKVDVNAASSDVADNDNTDVSVLNDEDIVDEPQQVTEDNDVAVEDDEDMSDVTSDGAEVVSSTQVAAVVAPAQQMFDVDALVAQITEQITEQIRENSQAQVLEGLTQADMDELIARQTTFFLENGLLGGGATGADQRIINQLGHSIEQSTEDLDSAVARNFLDDDLGLRLDTSMFDNTVYGQLPQLQLPDFRKSSQTPWLNDQLEALVRNINSELEADYMRRREVLRNDYVKMLTADIESISREVSVKNPNSRYFPLQETADKQRADMLRRQDQRVGVRRQELLKDYEQRRRAYVERRKDELGVEFDREHKADHDHAVRMAENDLRAQTESIYNAEIAHMNQKRKADAQQRYRLSQYQGLAFMESAIREMHEDEAVSVRKAAKTVEEYIEKMAQDDIRHGEIMREQMDRDNRVSEVREDAERQIEAARQHADTEITRYRKATDDLREEHAKFIEDLNRDNAERIAHAERQVEAVRAERDSDREHLETVRQRYEEKALAREQDAEERVKQAQADLDAYVASQKSDNTTMIMVMVVLSLVMLAAGAALGNIIF